MRIIIAVVPTETSRARNELQRSLVFTDMYREMEAMFLRTSTGKFFFYSPIEKDVYKAYFE